MNYAVIETGGKQYQVRVGDEVFIEKLDAEKETDVVFDKVSVLAGENGLEAGTPFIKGAEVKARVLKNGRGKKITVFTYKRRKNYKRTKGHRQPYSLVRIDAIESAKQKSKKEPKETKETKREDENNGA